MSDGSNATAHNKQRVREVIDVPQVFRIEDGMVAEHWDVVQLSQGGA